MADEIRNEHDLAVVIANLTDHNPMDRTRPYDGQPHTDAGERGKTLVQGLTFRDVCDCFVRGWLLSSGGGQSVLESPGVSYNDVYEHESVDPLAVMQNMACEMERMMGIFPNVPPLVWEGPTDA